jgi:TrmH family RNA methyltransferase
VERAGGTPVIVSEGVFKAVAGSETPQGIALELRIPTASRGKGCAVFLEGIQDAGNVGTLLRSAAAFGVRSAVLDKACADPWSPKVLRAGAGAHFVIAIGQASDLQAEVERFAGKTVSTVVEGGTPLSEADLSGTVGWIFGSEGQGVSAALQQSSDLRVRIPLARGTESLNVAAAAAICLYQAVLSRSAAGS